MHRIHVFSLHKVLQPLSTHTRCCYFQHIHSSNASLRAQSYTKNTVRENIALVNANSRETSQLIALLRCYPSPDFNALSTCPLHTQAINHPMLCAKSNLLQEHTLRFQWTTMLIILSVMSCHFSPHGVTTPTTPCSWTVDLSQNVQKYNWNRSDFLPSFYSVLIV